MDGCVTKVREVQLEDNETEGRYLEGEQGVLCGGCDVDVVSQYGGW